MPSSPNPPKTAVPALERARANYELAMAYDAATAGWPGLHLGRLLYMSGDLDAAVAAFRASIASGHVAYAPAAAHHLGRLLEERGDSAAAIAAYRRACESEDPKQASAAGYQLGCQLRANGDSDAARVAFERAAAMKGTWYGHRSEEALRSLDAGGS